MGNDSHERYLGYRGNRCIVVLMSKPGDNWPQATVTMSQASMALYRKWDAERREKVAAQGVQLPKLQELPPSHKEVLETIAARVDALQRDIRQWREAMGYDLSKSLND